MICARDQAVDLGGEMAVRLEGQVAGDGQVGDLGRGVAQLDGAVEGDRRSAEGQAVGDDQICAGVQV